MTHSELSMMRGRLKTRHIVLLVHLDEQRSVLRAAKAAHMTQPGASKLLADLTLRKITGQTCCAPPQVFST